MKLFGWKLSDCCPIFSYHIHSHKCCAAGPQAWLAYQLSVPVPGIKQLHSHYISHYLLQKRPKMMQKRSRPLVPRRDWLIRDLLSFPQEAAVSSQNNPLRKKLYVSIHWDVVAYKWRAQLGRCDSYNYTVTRPESQIERAIQDHTSEKLLLLWFQVVA